ncbi:MAG: GNAT family N-acetyltransferase [Clostridiales bacterium]|jgi:ribosomal protein S18 acetylase RimI-like enzyme|nr:GNAT family N-acetyltransferase [Clostridiales bacterium]
MDYSFIIRRATAEDAKDVQCVMREAFTKYMNDAGLTGTVEALEESLSDIISDINTKYVYIAFVDGVPVGSIRINIDSAYAYISRFGVRSGYRNIGIGKSFMNLCDKLLLSFGVKRVSLHTASKYTELIRFYYGCGFYIESTSTERGYIRALLVKEYK